MKTNKLLATTMASIMVTGMISGCDFNPLDNVSPPLYASPDSRFFNPEDNIPPSLYAAPNPTMFPTPPSEQTTDDDANAQQNSDENYIITEENADE